MTTKQTRTRNARTADAEAPVHVELAAEAVLDGWTRDQVVDTLISRISRDRRYLAYRKACNRRTSYDDEVQQDMRALALAACWLQEALERQPHDDGPFIMAQDPRRATTSLRPQRGRGTHSIRADAPASVRDQIHHTYDGDEHLGHQRDDRQNEEELPIPERLQ